MFGAVAKPCFPLLLEPVLLEPANAFPNPACPAVRSAETSPPVLPTSGEDFNISYSGISIIGIIGLDSATRMRQEPSISRICIELEDEAVWSVNCIYLGKEECWEGIVLSRFWPVLVSEARIGRAFFVPIRFSWLADEFRWRSLLSS